MLGIAVVAEEVKLGAVVGGRRLLGRGKVVVVGVGRIVRVPPGLVVMRRGAAHSVAELHCRVHFLAEEDSIET